MATFNKLQPFVANIANGHFNLGSDQLTVALCAAANTPVNTNSQLTDLTQISYTNLSSRNITLTSSTQTGGTYNLKLNNLTLTASGAVAAFQFVVIYDSTTGYLIGWYDYGSAITMANGDTFTISFDGTNGLISIV